MRDDRAVAQGNVLPASDHSYEIFAERQALLLDLTRLILENEGAKSQLIGRVFEKIAPHFRTDMCLNYAFDGQAQKLRLVASHGIAPEHHDACLSLSLENTFCGETAAKRVPLIADARRIASEPNGAFVKQLGIRAYACHPLLDGNGNLLGTLSLGSTMRDSFSKDETDFFQTVCHFIALAWERQRSQDSLDSVVTRYSPRGPYI